MALDQIAVNHGGMAGAIFLGHAEFLTRDVDIVHVMNPDLVAVFLHVGRPVLAAGAGGVFVHIDSLAAGLSSGRRGY